ncbi:MAG: tannase/feruloyl esterase family alpha/beta hydrolase, partial [Tepidisphaeraceae bacterium]
AWALHGAYAVVTTDLGTAPNADSGIDNPEVWKDFGFRATHQMTLVGKQIIKVFYGQAQQYAYFNGSSTGGQQALQTAQRYPDDYDGIVAAIPAHCRTPLHAYFLWNYQILHACPFTPAQQQQVIEAGIAHMADRENPITAGKIVSDPRCGQKDIEAVIALAIQKDSTLTPAHADALRKLFDGPRSSGTGARIFNGLPIGSSFHGASDNLYLFKWVFGRNVDLMTLDFAKDIDTYTAALGPYLNAENPDLSAFKKRGGKLIMTSGSADPVVPFHGTLDYYERVIAHFGSIDDVTPFFRYYIIPGMAHGGGPGINQPPDMLQVVRNWREQCTIPDPLQGQRVADGKVEWQLPLYAYPTQAHWDAAANTFVPIDGPRGGVEPVAAQFLPPPAE